MLTIRLLQESLHLQDHFTALRRYYFMERGDWAEYFLSALCKYVSVFNYLFISVFCLVYFRNSLIVRSIFRFGVVGSFLLFFSVVSNFCVFEMLLVYWKYVIS